MRCSFTELRKTAKQWWPWIRSSKVVSGRILGFSFGPDPVRSRGGLRLYVWGPWLKLNKGPFLYIQNFR